MDLLLDTHTLIWFINGDSNLSKKVKLAIEDINNDKFVSIASIWEIAIKISIDKFRFKKGLKKFLELVEEDGFEILPISFNHALTVSTLEFLHRDPFDRIIVSQCIVEKLILATKDEHISKYKIKTLW